MFKVIEVPESRIKSLDNNSLIAMVERIHKIAFVTSATRGTKFVPIGIPTICVHNLVINQI